MDADQEDSPVIELPVTELRGLLSRAERDLADFMHLVEPWAARHVPGHAEAATAAVARALAVPAPVQ
ncbi:hypothetical protein [Streptomyces erythrochromogenes]|uniref:hypothetical protein n=1 Tax=Streptomyces erythrochromogenes TaxID=285574 RepID=UPI0036821318